MGLLYPELLLLALPAAFVLWWIGGTLRGLAGLRALLLGLLLLAAAGPYLPLADPGHDVVVVVDRSLSMPAEAGDRAEELLRLVEGAAGAGDRVGVVVFGARPRVLRAPLAGARSPGLPTLSGEEAAGSDLAAGLETALSLLPRGRAGRVLLVSDGLADGGDALAVARRAGARGVPIDVRPLTRSWEADVRVAGLEAPAEVAAGEPLALVAWVQSDRAVTARYALSRGDAVIRSGEAALVPGPNRLVFRDLASEAGVLSYGLRVSAPDDPLPEDDLGLAAVRVTGPRGVLVLNHDGGASAVSRALAGTGLAVTTRAPEQASLDAAGLAAFRVVVLEDVSADRLGPGLDTLAAFVEDGGGLLMTGGPASFGVGGYHASALDPLLPVSMEQRQEQREQGIALAIAMDRSGSMAEVVDGGRTKMDLANLGAAAAIKLLGPVDHLAVLAVDEAAHVVLPLSAVTDPSGAASRVRRVQSEGGGIYTRTAIVAAAKLLEAAPQKNKHITLFADAADSEEQEGAVELVRKLRAAGVTLSVIAVGSRFDPDAKFLEALVAAGGGTIAFTVRPTELPRLFAKDTLIASRSSVVEEPTATAARPELRSLVNLDLSSGPRLEGYNLTWIRPGALVGLVTTDERKAPVFAFRQSGAGRTAAFTGQVGGSWGRSALAWEGLGALLSTTARWLGAAEAPAGWFASVERRGQEVFVSVERDPEGEAATGPLSARLRDPDGGTRALTLTPAGPDRWEASARLAGEGLTLGVVSVGEQVLALPPVALAWSPELAPPADPSSGERLLRRIASASGGALSGPVDALFSGEAPAAVGRVLTGPLVGIALGLMLLEITGRRLWSWGAGGRRAGIGARAARAEASSVGGGQVVEPGRSMPEPQPAPAAAEPAAGELADAMARARERARQTLRR